MKLTFKQWWKELRTEEGYGDMDAREIAERAWMFSKGQENRRIAEWCETHAIATDTQGGYVVIEPVKGAMFDGQRYAREIRKGDV